LEECKKASHERRSERASIENSYHVVGPLGEENEDVERKEVNDVSVRTSASKPIAERSRKRHAAEL